MDPLPAPPKTYQRFIARYPKLREAWDCLHEAGSDGPLTPREVRLLKLAVSIGALREGAVHSGVRKALAAGIAREEIEQLVALAAGTLGMPAAVAVFSWCEDAMPEE